jgi:hypothetical protein
MYAIAKKLQPKDQRTSKQQDLDNVPEPEVRYVDQSAAAGAVAEGYAVAVQAAKLAYLAKKKGALVLLVSPMDSAAFVTCSSCHCFLQFSLIVTLIRIV